MPGLEPLEEEAVAALEEAVAKEEEQDTGESREEQSFRMWFVSLGIDSEVTNLFEDIKVTSRWTRTYAKPPQTSVLSDRYRTSLPLRVLVLTTVQDGVLLLEAEDAIQPGAVDWSAVYPLPTKMLESIANLNASVTESADRMLSWTPVHCHVSFLRLL